MLRILQTRSNDERAVIMRKASWAESKPNVLLKLLPINTLLCVLAGLQHLYTAGTRVMSHCMDGK